MKKYSIPAAALLTLLTIAGFPEKADAQKHKVVKVKTVRPGVKVVKIHPHVHVVRRAHIHYAHLPRWGAVVTVVPSGAVIIRRGVNPYYYHNGVYYLHRNNGYAIVRPSVGIRISILPVGYRPLIISSRRYYYYYGAFYINAGNNEYEVVDAPEGAIVDALPDGYEVRTIKGTEYYVLDDVFYAEIDTGDIQGGIGYQVVKAF